MENISVKELINNISESISQVSVSQKDEIKVMRAMLNDRSYSVDIYDKSGVVGTICPSQEARSLAASIISDTTKISAAEAQQLADNHEFGKSEAVNMINISKEFVNTYLQTGRKLSLGAREHSDISIASKQVKAITRKCPYQTGVDSDGNKIYDYRETYVPEHESLRVFAPCPPWIQE